MGRISLSTFIQAPMERCFDLSRNVELHLESTKKTHERAIGGVTTGFLEKDDFVVWSARHLGLKFTITVKITEFCRPTYFKDCQIDGIFDSFSHEHYFETKNDGTVMKDIFTFKCPFGVFGSLADKFIEIHLTKFLLQRNEILKRVAESSDG